MSRLPKLGQGSRSPEQEAVFEKITSSKRATGHGKNDMIDDDGALGGPFNAMLYSPALGDAMLALGAAIRFETGLEGRLRELAVLLTASRWQSQYEWYAHERIARDVGIADSAIEALHAGAKPDFEREDEALVFEFTKELLETHRLGDATYARAVELLGYQGVVELVATLGNYTMVSMLLNCFEIPVPSDAQAPFPLPGPGAQG